MIYAIYVEAEKYKEIKEECLAIANVGFILNNITNIDYGNKPMDMIFIVEEGKFGAIKAVFADKLSEPIIFIDKMAFFNRLVLEFPLKHTVTEELIRLKIYNYYALHETHTVENLAKYLYDELFKEEIR